jgi:hypothetical protein
MSEKRFLRSDPGDGRAVQETDCKSNSATACKHDSAEHPCRPRFRKLRLKLSFVMSMPSPQTRRHILFFRPSYSEPFMVTVPEKILGPEKRNKIRLDICPRTELSIRMEFARPILDSRILIHVFQYMIIPWIPQTHPNMR